MMLDTDDPVDPSIQLSGRLSACVIQEHMARHLSF